MDWTTLERYQTFGFALVKLDGDGLIVNCTTAFASILGRDRHDTIGLTVVQLTAPEYRQRARERIKVAKEGKHDRFATDKEYLLPNGQHVHCLLETVHVDKDHVLSAISKYSDSIKSGELDMARRQRDEFAKKLDDVHEKMYSLMIAVAQRNNAIDVNLINGGQNNIGKNKINGDQNQS